MIDIEKIKALAAFADRLRIEDTLCKHGGFTEEADLIDTLLSELEAREADRRDAARYRWLRDDSNAALSWEPMVFNCHPSHPISWVNALYGENLDNVIDAALAQRQGEGHV
ncbi:hypothetical protein [Burkholderia sp. HI2500]|uniref:hypothetical protein n=1 Tax=Burkholderia sp. HI2500 TaxID=2015358 RepID=UPI000B7A5BE1|nr:hypothetical protein [Burkholderia sp. HI2500]OXJ16298.1 hypothetical protein CFB45_06955 [Burkholderia sp. HI2500]